MSQSPLNETPKDRQLNSYRQGWKALNRLLHENKSFSGRETNNAFLNCGSSGEIRFADVSSAIGWDFADDARAIAPIDWDHDGDLDIWVTNRTAPRLRLLENRTSKASTWVSFLLEGNGTTVNRDGIGAKVTVKLKGDDKPLTRSLHAGHSFLSQQTRHLHFGLGGSTEIENVTVAWPGATTEQFSDVKIQSFHHLKQGTGKAIPLPPRKTITLEAHAQTPLPATPIARIIPPAGHILPALDSITWDTTTLIQLWSPACPHCLEELPHWKDRSDLIFLATEDDEASKSTCEALFKKHGITQPLYYASSSTMQALDAFQSSIIDLWVPLPVPSSFLVTAQNEVLAIYRGPVSDTTLSEDRSLSSRADRRSAAAPFPGIWISDQPIASPLRTANQLTSRGAIPEAISYLKTALKKPPKTLPKTQLADTYLLLGQLLGQSGKGPEAIKPLSNALKLVPQDVRIILLLATAYQEKGQLEAALKVNTFGYKQHPENTDLIQQRITLQRNLQQWKELIVTYQEILKRAPNQPALKIQIAFAYCELGTPSEALTILKSSLSVHPQYLETASQLSRILSTHPDPKIRSPHEALILAERLCKMTKDKNSSFLLTKALALANQEKFKDAQQITAALLRQLPPQHPIALKAQSIQDSAQIGKAIRHPHWPKVSK